MSSVLEAFRAETLQEVTVPKPRGAQMRLRVIPPDEAVSKGLARRTLRDAVLALTGRTAKPDEVEVSSDNIARGLSLRDLHVSLIVVEARLDAAAAWEPVELDPRELENTLPPETLSALRDIAAGRRTPAMVTALVQRMYGEISEEEAVAVIEAETPKLTSDWESFRHLGRRLAVRAGGQDVVNAAKPAAAGAGSAPGA